jgi:hypothetical protein
MHPYLRAYMSGIALPTMVVPFVLIGLSLQNSTTHAFHIEDVLVFPIGLVPNAWGLWNLLYVWLRRHREIPIGVYGAGLAVLLAPLAFGLQLALGKMLWTTELFAVGFPAGLVVYYLTWRFVVARFNDLLGIG